jgi:hypothetical protein
MLKNIDFFIDLDVASFFAIRAKPKPFREVVGFEHVYVDTMVPCIKELL